MDHSPTLVAVLREALAEHANLTDDAVVTFLLAERNLRRLAIGRLMAARLRVMTRSVPRDLAAAEYVVIPHADMEAVLRGLGVTVSDPMWSAFYTPARPDVVVAWWQPTTAKERA